MLTIDLKKVSLMSTVSLVFHTIVTVKLTSKMYFEQTHPFYYIRYPCFNSRASPHTFSSQATKCKQTLVSTFIWSSTRLG